MSAETPKPRDPLVWVHKRQRVEARYTDETVHAVGNVIAYTDAPTVVIETDEGRHVSWRADMTFVADDPSKDKPGAYRTAHRDGATLVKLRDNHWAAPREGECTPLYYSDADMAEIAGPLVGVLPGTPAAEVKESPARPSVRVPNEPHGIPLPVRQEIADLLRAGNKRRAVGVLAGFLGIDESAATEYVESMSEYQTYLAAHGSTEVDPTEADRMRAMGFDRQPEFELTDHQRAEIKAVLQYRSPEFFETEGDGYAKLRMGRLSGVVADIVFAAIRRDRERGDR